MGRALTDQQESILTAQKTRPVFIVEIDHGDGIEYLSAGSDVQFGENAYAAGGIAIKSVQDSEGAVLELVATPNRVSQIEQGAYRGGVCRIWSIPSISLGYGTIYLVSESGTDRIVSESDDLIVGETAAEDMSFRASDGILMLEGLCISSRLAGNRVVVIAEHVNSYAKMTPRYTVDAVTTYAPAPGTVIEWEGELYTLESRR